MVSGGGEPAAVMGYAVFFPLRCCILGLATVHSLTRFISSLSSVFLPPLDSRHAATSARSAETMVVVRLTSSVAYGAGFFSLSGHQTRA
jgi:hypothetical protein